MSLQQRFYVSSQTSSYWCQSFGKCSREVKVDDPITITASLCLHTEPLKLYNALQSTSITILAWPQQ